MKIRGVRFAALVIASAVALTACMKNGNGSDLNDGKGKTHEEPEETPVSGVKTIKFATGGTTGTYYVYAEVIANILNGRNDDVNLYVQSTGASKANIFMLHDGQADVALVQNDVMDYASNGTDLFAEDGAMESFSAAAALYAEICQIIAVDEIKSIGDLRGKRVSVGDAGSGVEFNARQILEVYGITFDDIDKNNLSFGESKNALRDGKIDAFFCTAGAPTTAITELSASTPISLLGIDVAHAKELQEKYPFYTRHTVQGGTYKGIDEDVETVAVKATLIVSDRLGDDIVYQLVKGIFENKEEIKANHVKGAELDPQYAVEGISVKFHPGAEKYFKEIEVLP